MKLEFYKVLGIIWALLILATVLALTHGEPFSSIGFAIASFGGMIALSVAAFWLRRRDMNFPLGDAALLIQVTGIFALCLSMGVAISTVIGDGGDFKEGSLKHAIWPAVEALVSAGLGMALSAFTKSLENFVFGGANGAGAVVDPAAAPIGGGVNLGPNAVHLADDITRLHQGFLQLHQNLQSSVGISRDLALVLGELIPLLQGLGALVQTFDRFFARGAPTQQGANGGT